MLTSAPYPELAPYLFLTHVSERQTLGTDDNDAEFMRQLERYPCLCSLQSYRCLTAYKQHNLEYPRYLVVQEFDELEKDIGLRDCQRMQNEWYKLKRKQAKAWWWRQGFEGARARWYKLAQVYNKDEDMT